MVEGFRPNSETIAPSHSSWHTHRELLSQIPTPSKQDKELLNFLEKRWLAKANGFYSAEIDWICPMFGYSIQVNPETTNCYARDPGRQTSRSYTNRLNDLKKQLPQPESFPLILTRPYNVSEYLPSHLEISSPDDIQKLTAATGKVIVDLTHALIQKNEEEWLQEWESYRAALSQTNPEMICIQRVECGGIGGLRILPLNQASSEKDYRYLLDWVSQFGITANLVELDRSSPISNICCSLFSTPQHPFLTFLNTFDWRSDRPEKVLMVQGALSILKGLFDSVPKEKWNGIFHNPTRSGVANLSFSKIEEELKTIANEKSGTPFHETAIHLEEIFAHISNLLEVATPFSPSDFSPIYLTQLKSIPEPLRPLTSCSIHSCAMASIAGIFKAVEKLIGSPPKIIYGENTYFECVGVSTDLYNAKSIEEATVEDLMEADLILAQFNPVLKRTEPEILTYKQENISKTLRKALNLRQGKPLTAAIDCTIDLIDSPQVGELLIQFQKEIESGILNIVCYKSGLKFDLFGMDNYAGAPFYMIHSPDPKWAPFDLLTQDPSLLTDRLSASWFCLAYQYAVPYLDQYRKTIFDNTRNLLNSVPERLFKKTSEYRIIPVDVEALPSFIDIRVSGPLHKLRSSALVGGPLYLKCMQGGQPMFYRRTFGLYHPNFGMLFGDKSSTARLTLGLDPLQIELFAECLREIDALNGPNTQ